MRTRRDLFQFWILDCVLFSFFIFLLKGAVREKRYESAMEIDSGMVQTILNPKSPIQNQRRRLFSIAIYLMAIACFLLVLSAPAEAATCRQVQGHEICLQRVQRSAKYHWRYRVTATVDGEQRPLTRYDCRDRTQTPLAGSDQAKTVKFSEEGIGNLVCQLLNR